MPISFKSALSSAVANATFVDATVDDEKKGILGLYKVANTDPDAIADVQDFINEIANIQGTVGEADPNSKTYSSEQIIANGDDRKAAIGKLDAQVKINLDTNTTQAILITNNTRTTYANEAIAAAGTITKDDTILDQVRRVSGDGAATTAANAPFGDCSSMTDGVKIILRRPDSTNTITLEHNDIQYGLILNGNATLENYYELEVMYDSVAERFIEQRRNF
jgi:hypothetical protein